MNCNSVSASRHYEEHSDVIIPRRFAVILILHHKCETIRDYYASLIMTGLTIGAFSIWQNYLSFRTCRIPI